MEKFNFNYRDVMSLSGETYQIKIQDYTYPESWVNKEDAEAVCAFLKKLGYDCTVVTVYAEATA